MLVPLLYAVGSSFGFAETAAAGNGVRLAVMAADLSQKTEKELRFRSPSVRAVRTEYTLEELSHAVGRTAGVIGIADDGFAAKAAKLLGER